MTTFGVVDLFFLAFLLSDFSRDPFNDWFSIADNVNDGASVFAETLPSPRNFYLVNLLNCFGVFGGFKFLRWLGTQKWTSVNVSLCRLNFPGRLW